MRYIMSVITQYAMLGHHVDDVVDMWQLEKRVRNMTFVLAGTGYFTLDFFGC